MSEILEQAIETNGHGTATPVAGMKRMAAQKTASPVQEQHSVAAADTGASRLQSKKIAEDKRAPALWPALRQLPKNSRPRPNR